MDNKNKVWHINGLVLFFLFLCNPVLWLFDRSVSVAFPDSIAYITLAKEIIRSGTFYLHGWGHVDNALILPPVYPALIAMCLSFLKGGILSAEFVSSICIILSTIPLYFYVMRISSRTYSILSIILIQLNYYYLFFGTTPLTEATFILTLSIGLYLQQKLDSTSNNKIIYFYLGIASAVIFLTRQTGISFILSFIIFTVLTKIFSTQEARKKTKYFGNYFLAGFLVLIIPYSIILYNQTGRTFISKKFRIGDYSIAASQNLLSKIKVNSIDLNDYDQRFIQRRELRELTPDSSEMLGYVANLENRDRHSVNQAFENFLSAPLSFPKNIFKNLLNIRFTTGWIPVTAFAISLISLLSVRPRKRFCPHCPFLPLFLFTYISLISFVSGAAIDRYIQVIFPFVIIAAMHAIYTISNQIAGDSRVRIIQCVGIFFAAVCLLLTPKLSINVKSDPKIQEQNNPYQLCSQYIEKNAPVFTIHPFDSYFLGGWFRVLPNDSLDKIASYASKTGVKWMLFDAFGPEREHYTKARWMDHPEKLETLYPDIIKLRCRIGYRIWLYEFKTTNLPHKLK